MNGACLAILGYPPPSEAVSDPPSSRFLERVAAGEPRALRELVDEWTSPLMAFFWRSTGNRQDAEDLTAQTIERVFRAAPRYREQGSLGGWIFTIAHNRLRSFRRWQRIRPYWQRLVSPQVGEAGADDGDWLPEPSETSFLEGLEAGEEVQRLLEQLPEQARTLLLLSVQQGLSHREIGAIVGLSEGAVRVRIHRARALLRQWETGKGNGDHDE